MRCPKCGYISFDKITSCSQCETDVTEIASSLKGTGFQPMDNFFLGVLLPDYLNNGTGSQPSNLQDAADDLDISMEALDNLGEIGNIPGEADSLDLGLGGLDPDNTISLQGVIVPEVDLSDFDDDLDNIDTMQISPEQLDEIHAQEETKEEQIDLDDVPDFDLGDINLEEEAEEETQDLSLQENNEEKTERLDAVDPDEDATAVDLSAIDLSLGEEETQGTADLADLDLGDLEMESETDEKKKDDIPDLEM
jgi:hypothetical protein